MQADEHLAGILRLSDKYSLYYSTSKILYIATCKTNGHESKIEALLPKKKTYSFTYTAKNYFWRKL